MSIDNLTDDELKELESTRNVQEWSAVCARIKSARDGVYPNDWWSKVQLTGFMARVQRSWSAS